LDDAKKDYWVSLNSLVSAASKDKINANDVTTVVFAVIVNGKNSAINTTLSNVSFIKQDAGYLSTAIGNKELSVYPNPVVNKNLNCNFYNTGAAQTMTVRVTDLNGRVILSKQINAVQGINNVNLSLNSNTASGMHLITVENANGERFKTKSVMIVKP
jgi:hypothetical protein